MISVEINKITCADCVEFMKSMQDNSVNWSLTSPPYNIQKSINHNCDMYKNYKDNIKGYFDFIMLCPEFIQILEF